MTQQIMMVDDDPDILRVYSILLERHGFEVVSARDAPSALKLREEILPDLFILDVMMPGMNGIELCRHLRGHDETAHTPVVMLSGRGDPETIEEALAAGANDYLAKPIHPQDLLAIVLSLLGRGEGERAFSSTAWPGRG